MSSDPTDDDGKRPVAANDNASAADPNPEVLRKVDGVALKLARIIGRRMAREDFEKAMQAANDNTPKTDATDNE
ncbi:MAG: hypothetical protein WA975_10370 [Mesorhizobium sp.]